MKKKTKGAGPGRPKGSPDPWRPVTLSIPSGLYAKAKAKAEREGKTISGVVAGFLDGWVSR